MRLVLLVPLLLLVACGGQRDPAKGTPGRSAAADTAAVDSVAIAPVVPAELIPAEGSVRHNPEGGFSVYWPDGCERLTQSESGGATRVAEREVVVTCRRSDVALSVRCLKLAHDVEGNPPHPRLVVSLIEQQLHRKKLRTVRQRPLEAGAVQGVEVQAEGQDSKQRAWFRGLLVGHDVYLLMAIGEAPDLFDRGDIADFFASFRPDP
ncbi:MAG: hypothetical protein R3D98_14955 [Candidatus Krumholzibacteriia bacterium]